MSVYHDNIDKLRSFADLHEDRFPKTCRNITSNGSPKIAVEHVEKRVRREIANSNERRRMQSINTGFESLKTLLPTHDGEKLSKAAILQLTTKFITNLVSENRRLSNQLISLRQITSNSSGNGNSMHTSAVQSLPNSSVSRKRKVVADTAQCDANCEIPTVEELLRENTDLKFTLSEERFQREKIETQIKNLRDTKLRPDLCEPVSTSQSPHKPDYEEYAFERVTEEMPSSGSTDSSFVNPTGSLDHLIMAIEQIEGKFACGGRQQISTPAFETFMSHALPVNVECDEILSSNTSSMQSMVSPFTPKTSTEHLSNTMNHEATLLFMDERKGGVVDYPIVSKLLNRPIPHKYLHRSHVIVNSMH